MWAVYLVHFAISTRVFTSAMTVQIMMSGMCAKGCRIPRLPFGDGEKKSASSSSRILGATMLALA
ncbi:hypothetical protein AFL94_03230 [Arthrobacter sp. LS16]|nr:hypothetical protein AFL94_03230 [Arthrobacter sp. LS16]